MKKGLYFIDRTGGVSRKNKIKYSLVKLCFQSMSILKGKNLGIRLPIRAWSDQASFP
jgi:hypothetical protein